MDATLDHVGIVVPNLDEASRFVEALGFTLTRRAGHATADNAGRSAGSAQRSIMFERGYIELQELADLAGAHPVAPAARRFFGLHIVAFAVTDAAAAHQAIADAQLAVGPILNWSRPVTEMDVAGDAKFAFFVGDYGPRDDSFLCWTQHMTPELLRTPRLIQHANGSTRLSGIVIATDGDPAVLAARYVRSGGTPTDPPSGADAAIIFGHGLVEIARRATLPGAVARETWPAQSWAAAAVLSVRDQAAFTHRANSLGCPVHRHGARTYIDVRARLGCWLAIEGQ